TDPAGWFVVIGGGFTPAAADGAATVRIVVALASSDGKSVDWARRNSQPIPRPRTSAPRLVSRPPQHQYQAPSFSGGWLRRYQYQMPHQMKPRPPSDT